jgi:hypothetical protein
MMVTIIDRSSCGPDDAAQSLSQALTLCHIFPCADLPLWGKEQEEKVVYTAMTGKWLPMSIGESNPPVESSFSRQKLVELARSRKFRFACVGVLSLFVGFFLLRFVLMSF